MKKLYLRKPILDKLSAPLSLDKKVVLIHREIRKIIPGAKRLAIADYDTQTDMVKTFLSSTGKSSTLQYYDAPLKESRSLMEIYETRKARVVNDLHVFAKGGKRHTSWVDRHGYRSSYTFPIWAAQQFIGFIFINADKKNAFKRKHLYEVDLFCHLLANLVKTELVAVKVMISAIKTANDLVHYRDPETGNHLERMSRFARLIALDLVKRKRYSFNDDFIEHLFLFSPLHDLGKIAIPDDILLKPGRLNDSEFQIMRTHAEKGREAIDSIIKNFGFESFGSMAMLQHIAEYHHEAIDGSGYPHGLEGAKIPIEARITAVADIFDALTSTRPYKPAWSNEEALDHLKRLSLTKLDRNCVKSLERSLPQVKEIQEKFKD